MRSAMNIAVSPPRPPQQYQPQQYSRSSSSSGSWSQSALMVSRRAAAGAAGKASVVSVVGGSGSGGSGSGGSDEVGITVTATATSSRRSPNPPMASPPVADMMLDDKAAPKNSPLDNLAVPPAPASHFGINGRGVIGSRDGNGNGDNDWGEARGVGGKWVGGREKVT